MSKIRSICCHQFGCKRQVVAERNQLLHNTAVYMTFWWRGISGIPLCGCASSGIHIHYYTVFCFHIHYGKLQLLCIYLSLNLLFLGSDGLICVKLCHLLDICWYYTV